MSAARHSEAISTASGGGGHNGTDRRRFRDCFAGSTLSVGRTMKRYRHSSCSPKLEMNTERNNGRPPVLVNMVQVLAMRQMNGLRIVPPPRRERIVFKVDISLWLSVALLSTEAGGVDRPLFAQCAHLRITLYACVGHVRTRGGEIIIADPSGVRPSSPP